MAEIFMINQLMLDKTVQQNKKDHNRIRRGLHNMMFVGLSVTQRSLESNCRWSY